MAVYPTVIMGATDLIGGGDGAVDDISTSDLDDLDGVIAITDDGFFFYSVDPTSGAGEDSPYTIKPDDEGGDKRLLLQFLSESAFEAGTISFFIQSVAPTGWTKKVDWQDNAMLCYTSGAIGNGGGVNPQSVHAHGDNFSVDNHIISIAQMPSHYHSYSGCGGVGGPITGEPGSVNACGGRTSGTQGGSGGHNHDKSGSISNNTAPYYQTTIAATKD